jgi:DNA sulfur modification protein DndB
MATTLAAMRGRLGSTEYYLVTMKARELVDKVTIPKELEGWDDLGVEERYQRDIDYGRVRKMIAPYLATDPDRFFGSIIVAMQNADDITFEPVSQVAKGLPALYNTVAHGLGFLTLTGGEILIPLDGQHRLKAVEFAITGRDEHSKDIEGLTPSSSLAQEDVAVLLIKYDSMRARKIFNKVNRYAKPTSKSQNLITDDDDVIAIITRGVADQVIGGRLVNISSNTLTAKAPEFTTLSTLYESIDFLIGSEHKVDKSKLPEPSKVKLFTAEAIEVWTRLATSIDVFAAALFNKEEEGDDKRREIRSENLLGKPVAQLVLIRAFVTMRASKKADGSAFSEEEICKKLNAINWASGDSVWQGVLMHGDKIMSGKTAVSLATDFVLYLAGVLCSKEEKEALLLRYKASFSKEEQDAIVLPPIS